MNSASFRSSRSSAGDARYRSSESISLDPPQPPVRKLMDGYRDFGDSHSDRPRYNPLNPAHPNSSALLNTKDPVIMYLLTETALVDSKNYEVLSFEEVEELKKEYTFLSKSLEATRRKLAVEMKLRDAAHSLSRLQKPTKHLGNGDEYDSLSSPRSSTGSVRKTIFGKKDDGRTRDRTSHEIVMATHKCEELAHEVWVLERRAQEAQRRLLEHNAGILQMTHKGLKKNLKSHGTNGYTNGDIPEFDDRSLYKTPEHLDVSGGRKSIANGSASVPFNHDAIQSMETKLEELSGRMRAMILQAIPDESADPVPQPTTNGGPVDPTTTASAYLAYIENGLDTLDSSRNGVARLPEPDDGTEQQLSEINSRLHHALGQSGPARAPVLPPPPSYSSGNIKGQLSYLSTGLDTINTRIDSLSEQKGILTTQIQQQRELNNKSDAERDAHIADLNEQLAQLRKELVTSEQDTENAKKNLAFVEEQLQAARKDRESKDDLNVVGPEMEALDRAEAEIVRLETTMEELRAELDSQRESHAARLQADEEVSRLQAELDSQKESHAARLQAEEELSRLRAELDSQREFHATRLQADEEISRLQAELDAQKESHASRLQADEELSRLQAELGSQKESQAALLQADEELSRLRAELDSQKDYDAARIQAEEEISRLKTAMEQLQNEMNTRSEAHAGTRRSYTQSEEEVSRLKASMEQLENEINAHAEAHAGTREDHARAQEEVSRLRATMEQLQSEMEAQTRAHDEIRKEYARAEEEVSRLQAAMEQLRGEMDARGRTHAESHESRAHAEEEVSRLEAEISQLRNELDMNIEAREAREDADRDISQLEYQLAQSRSEAENHAKEATATRSEMEEEVSRLQAIIEHLQGEMDARAYELSKARDDANREIARLEAALDQVRSESDARIKEATEARIQAEEASARSQADTTSLESEVVRVQTELTMCKAELDAAQGPRSGRAGGRTTTSPAIQEEMNYLNTRNLQLTEELAGLKAGPRTRGSADLQRRVETLERELRDTIDDYEAITKASIDLEKEREKSDSIIDSLRDRCEQLEMHMNEDQINSMGMPSPSSSSRDGTSETTSTMVLKNEFKKMMRDTRAENMRILKAEQDERRRLEALIRTLRKEPAIDGR